MGGTIKKRYMERRKRIQLTSINSQKEELFANTEMKQQKRTLQQQYE